MKKNGLLYIILFFLINCFSWGQTTIESYDGTLGATGWTETDVSQGSASGNDYVQMLSSTSVLISPAMDFDSYTNEKLDFKARSWGGILGNSNEITISISTNNGTNWSVLGTRSPITSTLTGMAQFDLSSYNGSQVMIKMESLSATGSRGVGADDILIFQDDGVSPSAGIIFISEVSDATTVGSEYIELYNNSSNLITLSNSKLIRVNAGANTSEYVYDISSDGTGDLQIPPVGFIIIARGDTKTTFETTWSVTLSSSVNYNEGNTNLYFGATTTRRWRLRDGGTSNIDDGTLIDDTNGAVGGTNTRHYQNPIGTWVSDPSSNATPGTLDPGQVLPVELSSFSASIINNGVRLNWRTETEANNYGFNILRQSASGGQDDEWETLGFVEGHGNSNSPKEYSFIDENVTSGKYAYRLKQIDNDGTFEYSKIIEIDVDAPLEFELSQNYPNPFNPSTTIKFSLPVTSKVKLSVFNILGEEVQILVNETKEAGIYTINFSAIGGSTSGGNAYTMASGIYFYKLETNNFLRIKKMSLLR